MLKLKPLGYWPADKGEGKVLHDRSGNANHGRIYSVPWRDGSLVFENDVYQWVQVPCREAYRGRNFSMGGWVFSTLHKRKRTGGENEFQSGALIIGQPFRLEDDGKLKWAAIWGKELKYTSGAMLRFGLPDKGGLSLLDVVSGKEADVLGTVKAGIGLQSGQWKHIMYTYAQSGEAKLYVDGKLAHSAEGVPYTPSETPFVFGGGRWGTFNLGGTVSMAGSLKDMVIFDRTLSQEEIRKLTAMTKPSGMPGEIAATNREKRDLPDGLDQLLEIVKDESLDRNRRAEAALKLAQMGKKASGAVHVLAGELESIDREEGAHLPRVEEFFRNALIKALLEIDPNSERTEPVLAEALARPYFATLDLSRSYLKEVAPLLRSGKEMQALRRVKEHFDRLPTLPRLIGWGSSERAQQLDELRCILPLRQEYFDRYISKGIPFADAHYNAYNQIDTRNGSTYLTVVERVPYQEVPALYEKQLRSFSDQKPDPEGKWSRVKIVRIGPDGGMEQRVLMGNWFIYDARDAKMHGWAVALDRDGYIHLLGGQHNRPNQGNYVPGSWEKLGVSEGDDRPQVMYWVSTAPGEIGSFEFTGQSSNARSVVGWMNYMNFARDPEGRLFLYGRGRTWSWALLRYDADKKRWTEIRGSAAEMLRRAEKENPRWLESLGDTIPYFGPGDGLVCAWQPGAYNFNRGWGGRALSFDKTGRMHVRMAILGVGEDGRMTNGPVYAYSDDLGRSFHAADGKPLKLPLTLNPIPSHNGNTSSGSLKTRYDLWASLVKELP
ncbi:MAG: LamG-like jellyroll fold domain-containing protein [Planctomycetota bacterium]